VIVVDSSAIIALYLGEPGAAEFAEAIELDAQPILSVASLLECAIVMRRKKAPEQGDSDNWLDTFVATAAMAIHPVSADHITIARQADIQYGKGTGHPAQLNFGDCFAYALAKAMDVPLLYKGGDFARTDIAPAL